MSNFNLTIIRPVGFLHSSAFIEVRDSLAWALSALGHNPQLTENLLIDGEQNIVFGAELLAPRQPLPKDTIIYNLEQPSHPSIENVRSLAKGHRVWEYSKTNMATWAERGIDVVHVPIGYTPNLTRIPLDHNKDIDVLFFGWMTPRRTLILEKLKQAGLKVVATDRAYGGARDNLISRAKVVLNIHHDGRENFEIVRCSYLMANNACVVTEPSADDADYSDLRGLTHVPAELLTGKVQAIVKTKSDYIGRGYAALASIRKRDYVSYVETALAEAPKVTVVEARYQKALQDGDMKDFVAYLRSIARGNILEIGVRDGASTSAFLAGLEENGGKLTSLDIADCGHLFAGHPQWNFLQCTSLGFFLPDETYDVILIDGDHTREAFRQDLENCWKAVKPGGLIICHDIVTRPGWTLEEHPGSDLPSKHIRDEYFAFCELHGCAHQEDDRWPGLGTITKTPIESRFDSDESWEASRVLLEKLS